MSLEEAKEKINDLISKHSGDMILQLEDFEYDESCDEVIPVL